MLRILVLATDVYGGHGGIALSNRNLVQALVEMQEVKEIVVVPRLVPMKPSELPPKVIFYPSAAGGKFRYVAYSIRLALRGQYDLVVCAHIHLLPLAVMLNKYIRASLALIVHGIDVWQQPYNLAKKLMSEVNSIWSVSAVTRDRMNAWAGLDESRYALIFNAIRLEDFGMAAKRPDLLRRYKLEGSRVIMTLARLPSRDRHKGVDEVIELMPSLLNELPDLKYLVVGDGEDRPRLEAKAESLGLSEQIIFTGRISEADKADYFRLADAFVMPGRGEGFGFVFLEALACGVPVVGSQVDGSREALRDGLLGELVDPANPASVKRGILSALGKEKKIPTGLEYFAWPSFSARVSKLVRSVAN